MKARHESLGGKAAVKATILQAHLAWAQKQVRDVAGLAARVDAQSAAFLARPTLSTAWVPLRCLVQIDRAIAGAVGGDPERVFRDLGRHSAAINLGGVYRSFVSSEPHRFFAEQSSLHRQFQNFGQSEYERTGDRSGKITLREYPEYAPSYCISGAGYYEEALKMMKVPGPVSVRETSCQCAGDRECVFVMSW